MKLVSFGSDHPPTPSKIEDGQTTQWPKEKEQTKITKHTHKTKIE
jgi:hypothetical protein